MKIVILGAGLFGTALGGVLAENGYDLDYYDPKKEREQLNKVLLNTKIIILCTPSEVALRLLPYLPKDKPLVVASKGFLTDQVFAQFADWMVMSGPAFAEDMKEKKDTYLTITDTRIADLFKSNFMYFDLVKDKKAVLMCGALKNVYALLAGKLKLAPGSQKMKVFLEKAAFEMEMLLKENEANPDMVYHPCGLGDLIITCSPRSRNYEFGKNLEKGFFKKANQTVEGITTLKRIRRGEIKVPQEAEYLKQLIEDSKKWD